MRTAVGIMADSKQQGPPFSPEQLTGLRVWFDASDTSSIVHLANAVSQWNDKSGNLSHVTQATGASQPLTGSTSINGKNTLSFDGTDDFLSRVPTQLVHAVTGEWSAFGVVKVGSITGTRLALDQDSFTGLTRIAGMIRTASANLQIAAFNNVPTSFLDNGGTVVVGTSYYISAVRGAASIEAWRNGVSGASTATTGTNNTGLYNIGIGANRTGGVAQFFWQGEIGEIIAYDTALIPTDRIKIENYLKAKWGL